MIYINITNFALIRYLEKDHSMMETRRLKNILFSIFLLWKSNVDFFFFSKRVQTLDTEYKYGQYCTPLTQSDCRYFFVLAISLFTHWDNKVIKYANSRINNPR